MSARQSSAAEHVIILVHGIRDFALWEADIRSALEEDGFYVATTNYGRFNLLQFLAPIPYFRKKAISNVWEQIRTIRLQHQGARLSVIAHSFGTFIIANLMRDEFDIEFNRIIFCGSVVNYDFPFVRFRYAFKEPIINEVGTRDVWPAIAESVTTGYGSAGTYGFLRPFVRDRWHNGARHGFFLSKSFCKKFWIPWLQDGILLEQDEKAEKPVFWVQAVSIFKIKYILAGVLLCLLSYLGYQHAASLRDWFYRGPVSVSVPNPLTIGTVADLHAALEPIEAMKNKLSKDSIKQISEQITTTIIPSSNRVVPRVTRRFMNQRIVKTIIFLNDRDLSYVWRSLPSDLDLSYLDLSNLDLRGVTFKHAFMIYTKFNNAKLDDAVFDDSWVRNVDFGGASMSNVNFPETDWFNALNIPSHPKNGWPERYGEWMDCPDDYKAPDDHGFVHQFNKLYDSQFRDQTKNDVDDLRDTWARYSKPSGLCDLVGSGS
jgi:hypothetical protein